MAERDTLEAESDVHLSTPRSRSQDQSKDQLLKVLASPLQSLFIILSRHYSFYTYIHTYMTIKQVN